MTPKQQLDALVDQFIPIIRNAFLSCIRDIVDNVVINALVESITNGDLERALYLLGINDASMRPLIVAIEKAYETGGIYKGRTFPKFLNTTSGKAVFRFDVRNLRAEAYLRDKSSELITRITSDARVNIQSALTIGLQDGRNPRNTALDIVGRIDKTTGHRVGGVIGLTPNQEGWVRSARTKLETLDDTYFNMELRDKRFDRIVAKAIRDKNPLDMATVDKLTLRYRDKALKYRGDSIARTESIQGLNAAEHEAVKQAVATGAAAESDVTREWDDVGDGRTRPSHRAMNKQRVGLDEPFKAPGGALLMFPGDTSLGAPASETVMCRCRVRTDVDWFSSLD